MPVPATTGQLRTRVQDMSVGDYIACNVRLNNPLDASSNLLIGQLGTQNVNEASTKGIALPGDVKFYFIKVDTGLLVADRVVHNNVTIGTVLGFRRLDGMWLECLLYSDVTSNKGDLVRSLHPRAVPNDRFLWTGTLETSPKYIQWDYLYPKTLKQFILTTSVTGSGFEPLKDFKIIASNDMFQNSTEVFSGTYANPGQERVFDIPNDLAYMSYRLVMIGWQEPVAGDGQTLSKAIPVVKEEVKPLILRSLSGGVSYVDKDGNLTNTDNQLGCFPVGNEYDKYITRFPAELVRAGATVDDVFHCNSDKTGSATITNDLRANDWTYSVVRSHRQEENAPSLSYIARNSNTSSGYRPVIEYEEES